MSSRRTPSGGAQQVGQTGVLEADPSAGVCVPSSPPTKLLTIQQWPAATCLSVGQSVCLNANLYLLCQKCDAVTMNLFMMILEFVNFLLTRSAWIKKEL